MSNNLPEPLKALVEKWEGRAKAMRVHGTGTPHDLLVVLLSELAALAPLLERKIEESVKAEHARICFKPITGDRCKELEGIYGKIATASH